MVINKEVIFVGILAVLCLVLLGVAILGPKKAPKDPTPVTSSTDVPIAPTGNGSSDDLTAGSTSTSSTTTPFGANTAPVAPHVDGDQFSSATTAASTTGGGTFGGTTGGATFGGTTGGGFPSGTAPVAVTPPPADTGPKTYTVAGGDTLADISMHFYGTTKHAKDIQKANPGVVPEDLKIGQKLVIPDIASATPAGTGATPTGTGTGTPDAAGTYTIKSGDTLYGIAQRELGSPSKANIKAIAALNDMDVDDDLQVGKTIKLPAKAGTPAAADGSAATPTAPNATPNAAPVTDAGGDNTYTIQSGDTLEGISKKKYGTGTHWKAIQAANPGLDPSDMKVGQKITLPDLPGKTAPAQTPAATGGTTTGGPFGTAGATTGGDTFGGTTGGGFTPSATGGAHTSLDNLTPPPAAPTPAPASP